jgi:uncharacterized protein
MFLQLFGDILLLMGLGLGGWFLLARLRMPAAEILGPVVLIGTLRALQVDLPSSPSFLFPAAQVVIGIFVGSMINRETVRELKPMALSALIIITWALSIIFIIGFFLARYTALDLYTAMLSASMGGLPEITIIALASGAGIAVIVVTQMLRLLITVFIFPIVLSRLEKRQNRSVAGDSGFVFVDKHKLPEENRAAASLKDKVKTIFSQETFKRCRHSFITSWTRVLFTMALAAAGGLIFEYLGVPAGLLVGATVFIAAAAVAGIQVSRLSPFLFDLLLVYIGITIADNISLETISTIGNLDLLVPILIATAIIFVTSFIISWIIYKLTRWDYPTCFLAAAPGGFTMMTALAVKHRLDPLKVSMLHLCRLLSINMFLPFLFMFLMKR